MTVSVTRAVRGMAIDSLSTFGTIEPRAMIVLSPQAGGHVTEVLFQEGGRVAAGQPLVRLDDRVARSELASAQAAARLDRETLERDSELGRRGTKSRADIDRSRAALAASQASLAVKQTQLDLLTLRAPIDGVTMTRKVEVGSFLSPGEEAVTVADHSQLRVTFRLSERLLPRLSVGQPVTITAESLGTRPIEGKVTLVDPSVEADSRSVLLRAGLTPADIAGRAVYPGLFVNVSLELGRRTGAILVPRPAVQSSLSGDYVFVVEPDASGHDTGRVVRRAVTIGADGTDDRVEVVSGLDEGTAVVSTGQFKVEDGMRVAIAPASTPAPTSTPAPASTPTAAPASGGAG
ncbi:efflux RND transporter periplasmic adaptor subunit [Tistrella bauzanensis]|uniref:Efflux RND transporter periplasmic adaptor subunit n=1 Tax=Tistrella arctica TaxID=3133430 RepID=A0ABU9YPX9_9PROT